MGIPADVGRTVAAQYFVRLYQEKADPWGFETSPYEQAKYAATLEALPRGRYASVLEIGCSIGVFTALLAGRCDRLLGIDVADCALECARRRCSPYKHVRFEQRTMPHDYPGGSFDLTTLCEVGYYFNRNDLLLLRNSIIRHCAAGAHIVLVHWTPHVEGHASSADEVHAIFRDGEEVAVVYEAFQPTYRIDVLECGKHA